MKRTAPPASVRRRRRPLRSALLPLLFANHVLASPSAAPLVRVPTCTAASAGWCVARRFPGPVERGELGFRFGAPLDADGDGHPDVTAGARFKLRAGTLQSGEATVWSGATGKPIRSWDGDLSDGLFGHWTLLIPDVSGDGLADLVVAAPHAPVDGRMRGVITAYSPKTGQELWRRGDTDGENYGWDLSLAGDQNHDGAPDLFVGAPGADTGHVDCLDGKTGAVLHRYTPTGDAGTFGWYVALLDDLDHDGRPELAVGAPSAMTDAGTRAGGVWVLSAADGKLLHRVSGNDPRAGFGGVVAGLGDLNGDGVGELAIAAPGTEDQTRTLVGEVVILAGGTWQELRRWTGTQAGELYGRMVVGTGDLDGDGVPDLAIGAPCHRTDAGDRVGRLELRSGRTGAVIANLVGDRPDSWFGWHVRPATDPDGHHRPALLVNALRQAVDGRIGAGELQLLVRAHGTMTRGARRKDIK